MAKFAAQKVRPNVTAPIRSTVPTLTHEGGQGWARDAKSDLFLLAVTNMVAEDTFYEAGKTRDARFVGLIRQVMTEDPEWVARFVPYLRNTMNMRSASLVMAAEYVKAGGKNGRKVVSDVLVRADEPAEMLAYWAQEHGKRFPQPIKRGVADAVRRLYNEKAALKYGGDHAWRMADVIELVHPKPVAPWQSHLFRWILDDQHGRGAEPPEIIAGVQAWVAAGATGPIPEGMTWERLSTCRKMQAADWEAVIPQMGYMALLRNLRNFDSAGIKAEIARDVAIRLSDPEQVAKSRQLPLRFLSAWKAAQSMRWGQPLEDALNLSLRNIPEFGGKTLILVDDSASMNDRVSAKSQLSRREVAAVFGSALALRAENPDLVAYATDGFRIPVAKGGAVLRLAQTVAGATNGGTNTFQVLQAAFNGHDRVVILTDEQASAGPDVSYISAPIYTFNLAGYRAGHLPAGARGRYTFGGLTDAGFSAIALLESLKDASWPF